MGSLGVLECEEESVLRTADVDHLHTELGGGRANPSVAEESAWHGSNSLLEVAVSSSGIAEREGREPRTRLQAAGDLPKTRISVRQRLECIPAVRPSE